MAMDCAVVLLLCPQLQQEERDQPLGVTTVAGLVGVGSLGPGLGGR